MHNLARDGLLQAEKQVVGGKVRKYYLATATGRQALAAALEKVRELVNEIDPGLGEK
ncbi:MAG: PadR family transcriptional regulator [Anaerolineales bacterium]|nr:PadR family transcriptional regulator [Anaerolineales bacterium]